MVRGLNKRIGEKLDRVNCDNEVRHFVKKILDIEISMEDKDKKRGYKEKYHQVLREFVKQDKEMN